MTFRIEVRITRSRFIERGSTSVYVFSKTSKVNRITYWSQGAASLPHKCQPNVSLPYHPIDNIRVMVIVWRLRGNIVRTAPCWVVWHNVQSAAHSCEQFLQVQQIRFVTLGPLRHAQRRLPRVVLL